MTSESISKNKTDSTESHWDCQDYIRAFERKFDAVTYEIDEKPRTLKQNAALHAMLRDIALECQVQGITADKFEKRMFKHGIPITEGMMKLYAKEVSRQMFNENHTSKLNTEQESELAMALRDAVRKAFGIYVEYGDEPPMVGG